MNARMMVGGQIVIAELDGMINVPADVHNLMEMGYSADKAAELVVEAKADIERQKAGAAIKKEVVSKLNGITIEIKKDGKSFIYQADERSRNLISQAINAAEILGKKSAPWRMANNEWRDTSLDELRQISAQGLMKHGEIMQQAEADAKAAAA